MAKISIPDVQAGFSSVARINSSFQQVEDELNNNVLYRNNPLGEANQMMNDLDMNSNDILNSNRVQTTTLVLNGQLVTPTELATTTLPDQTNNAGAFLSTNAVNAEWDRDVRRVTENVASLIALSGVQSGDVVATRGYTTANDGGGAEYIIRTSSEYTDTPDELGGAFTMTNGLIAVLSSSNTLNVKQFGAIGNGVAADRDNIQAAIEYAYDQGFSQLIFNPNHTFLVDDQIFFNGYPGQNGLTTGLFIQAQGATIKLSQASTVGHVIGIGRGAYVGEDDNIELTGDLTWDGGIIDCNNIAGENGFGISRVQNVIVKNVQIKNSSFDAIREGGRGITTHAASYNVSIENCFSYNMGDGFHVSPLPDNRSDIGGADLFNISGITQAASAVITTTATHNYQVGEYVYVSQVGGMTEINPSYELDPRYEITAVTATTLTINLNTTGFTAYTSGGIVVRADELHYRNHRIAFINCRAEECDHSGFNAENANQPRTTSILSMDVLVDGFTAINCGANSTDRGIINGDNASGIVFKNLKVYNTSDFPVSDVIRGTWQRCSFEGMLDVNNARSYINAEPLTGGEAGITEFPFGITFDTDFTLKIHTGHTISSSILKSADRGGSSIDYTYRNKYILSFFGKEGGNTHTLMDTFLQASQSFMDILDFGAGGKRVTGLSDNIELSSPFRTDLYQAGVSGFEAVNVRGSSSLRAAINLDADSGNAVSRVSAQEDGTENGYFEYRHGNDRWYMNMANADNYQFTANNILPSVDNAKDLGSGGLRMRTIYAGTGTINTSDERLKTPIVSLSVVEQQVAMELKSVMGKFKFLDAIEAKGEENARIHVGIGAQTVKQIFESHGLNPDDYALFCYDEWEAEYNEDGSVMLEAGNRYGIRYEELLGFIITSI